MPRGRLLVIAVLLLTGLTGIPTSAAAEPANCEVRYYIGGVLELRDSKPFEVHVDCGWWAEDLEIAVTDPPQHGSVGSVGWDSDLHEHLITYDPIDSYTGPDQFILSVSDGIEAAHVSVQLEMVPNTAPRCEVSYFSDDDPVILHSRVGGAAGAIMVCEDLDLQDWYVLDPTVADQPEHGSVDFAPPSLDPSGPINVDVTYSPEAGYTGFDSFVVDVSDGSLSDQVTFDVAVADGLWCRDTDPLQVDAGKTATTYTFCTDPDFGSYSIEVVDTPAKGTAAVEGALIRYTADPGASSVDSFTFRATGPTGDSNLVTQRIEIVPNAAPTCEKAATTVAAETPAAISLVCTDEDEDPVDLAIATAPTHGELTEIAAGQVTYTPDPGFAGVDRFTYTGSDYARTSMPATVRIIVDDSEAPVLKLGVARQKPRKVARRGLDLSATSDEMVTGRVRVTVSGRTAKRLGLVRKADGPVQIGSARADLEGDVPTEIRLQLRARAAKAIGKATRVPITVRLRGVDPVGDVTELTRRVTLRR